MIIRRRLRNALIPLALYSVAGPVCAYFIWHSVHGDRGLNVRAAYKIEFNKQLQLERKLMLEEKGLERRIALLRAPAVDHDILDEQARKMLGRVSPADLVVFLPK